MAELQTDPPDIEQVYRDYRLTLVRLGFLLTGSREDSEDLVQSAFATASAHWYEIEQPLAYLKRAVVNQASDLHKRRTRERGRPAAEGVTEIPEIDETWAILQRLPIGSGWLSSCASTRTCRCWRSPVSSTALPRPYTPTSGVPSVGSERHSDER